MTLDTAEPDLSVIVTGQGPLAQHQAFGEHLLELARGSGYSAELIVVGTQPAASVEDRIVRAVGRARGRIVAFCDPGSGLAPETLMALVGSLADGSHDLAVAVCDQLAARTADLHPAPARERQRLRADSQRCLHD